MAPLARAAEEGGRKGGDEATTAAILVSKGGLFDDARGGGVAFDEVAVREGDGRGEEDGETRDRLAQGPRTSIGRWERVVASWKGLLTVALHLIRLPPSILAVEPWLRARSSSHIDEGDSTSREGMEAKLTPSETSCGG